LLPYLTLTQPEFWVFGISRCNTKTALSGNPVISVNGRLDVQQHKRREDRDSPLRPCVKLKNNNAKTQRRDGAKNKNLWVYFTGIFDCAYKNDQSIGYLPELTPLWF